MTNYVTNKELLDYFIEFLNSSKKNPATVENLKRDLNSFINYLHENNDLSIDSRTISDYLSVLEENYSESSFVVKASSIRQFVNWLNLEDNPFWKIKLNINYEELEYYSYEEIFSKFPDEFNYDHLLVKLIYELGLSLDELINFNLEDYNRARGEINLRNKNLSLSSALSDLMKHYIKAFRQELLGDDNSMALKDPLFIGRKNSDRIAESEILEILGKYNLRNSRLKRSRIIHMLNQGMEFSEIESLLGLQLSNFYRAFVKDKDYRLLTAYSQYHPRAAIDAD